LYDGRPAGLFPEATMNNTELANRVFELKGHVIFARETTLGLAEFVNGATVSPETMTGLADILGQAQQLVEELEAHFDDAQGAR